MSRVKDLTGMRFGRLQVLELAPKKGKQVAWKCLCDCGSITVVTGGHLKSGHTQSCGCLNREITKNRLTTHGQTHTRLHNIWFCMKARCLNPRHSAYDDYGGRGITICDEWVNDFSKFYSWAINNGYDENLSIDRINVNGDYTPNNCRWVTRAVQNNNTRANRKLTYNGQTMNITEWARRLGIDRSVISARIDRLHWSVERALTTPVIKCERQTKGIKERC